MITEDALPADYRPFKSLVLCSNGLNGVLIPFTVGDFVPLLIGDGDIPRVWLNAIAGVRRIPIVRDNETLTSAVTIEVADEALKIVLLSKTLILDCKKEGDRCIVSRLDLRPFGFNIHGDRAGLLMGGSAYVGNIFTGAKVMLRASAPPAPPAAKIDSTPERAP